MVNNPATENPGSVPPRATPVLEVSGNEQDPPVLALAYWRFLNILNKRTQDQSASIATGLTATGTTQGTALALENQWNVVSTTPANSGVLLDDGVGAMTLVWNRGANALKVYPPSGANIDGAAADAAYSLPVNKAQAFCQVDDNEFLTFQLG